MDDNLKKAIDVDLKVFKPGTMWEKKDPKVKPELPYRIVINPYEPSVTHATGIYSIIDISDEVLIKMNDLLAMTQKTILKYYEFKREIDLPWIQKDIDIEEEKKKKQHAYDGFDEDLKWGTVPL